MSLEPEKNVEPPNNGDILAANYRRSMFHFLRERTTQAKPNQRKNHFQQIVDDLYRAHNGKQLKRRCLRAFRAEVC